MTGANLNISPGESVITRFWGKFERGLGCWNWIGARDEDGYGVITQTGHKLLKAHRLSYLLLRGEIPPGLWVLHGCDNPRCVRPSHLHLGTAADNARERKERGRGATGGRNGAHTKPETRCRGSRSGVAKLTETKVLWLREQVRLGVPQAEVARRLGVGTSTVCSVVNNQTWTHV